MKQIAYDISTLALTGAGTSTYLRELLAALDRGHNDISPVLLDYKPFFSRSNRLLRVFDTLNRELVWQQRVLPRLAKNAGCAILHSPAMLCPLQCDMPIVYTVPDIYIVRSPGAFPLWQRNIMNRLFHRCVERADIIIAISQFTKNEILELYPHISEEKVIVTWLGVHERFKPVSAELKEMVRRKYALNRPFVLAVSTIEPRKNLITLIRAFARIKDRTEHDLVLAGPYGWGSKELYSLITNLGLDDRVRFTGYVDIEDLPAVYNLADIFVYPSLYEGFGLPPLEAMACGCPVITSDVASLPEVVGDAAEKLDPFDVEALACSMEKFLQDAGLRQEFTAKGLRRASCFTWEKCANDTVAVYNTLA